MKSNEFSQKEYIHENGDRTLEFRDAQGLLKKMEDFDSTGKLKLQVIYSPN
jgi:hypothetical protein